MFWTLANKVSAALLAILVCMMAAICAFAYWKLEDAVSGMVRSRYGVVVESLKSSIEDRSALGIPLYQQRAIQDQLERYKEEDSRIVDIEVFNSEGDILFNSDRGSIGARVPVSWMGILSDPNWNGGEAADEDSRMVGTAIMGPFGQPSGAVVLRYPASYLDARLGPLIDRLAALALVLVGMFGLLALVGAHILLAPIRSGLGRMEAELNALVLSSSQDSVPMPDSQDRSFDGGFARFAWACRDVGAHLNLALEELERLDRLA
jgi:hypothetical protein